MPDAKPDQDRGDDADRRTGGVSQAGMTRCRAQSRVGGPRRLVLIVAAFVAGMFLLVVAISIDANGVPSVRAFYERLGIRSLAVYVDPTGVIGGRLRIAGLPTTVLVDRDGRQIGRTNGPADWDGEGARSLIDDIRGFSQVDADHGELLLPVLGMDLVE